MAIVHRDENECSSRVADRLNLGVLQNVLSSIDRHHQNVDPAQLPDVIFGERAIVS